MIKFNILFIEIGGGKLTGSPWGVITASLIAGFIAFIGMLISKENKTSEFRQAWIVELRVLIAELISLYEKIRIADNKDTKAFRDSWQELMKVITNVRLHLNNTNPSPEEDNLINCIGRLNETLPKSREDWREHYDALLDCSHLVLKNEWERVKKGEATYILIKNILFTVFVICLSAVVVSFVYYSILHSGVLDFPRVK